MFKRKGVLKIKFSEYHIIAFHITEQQNVQFTQLFLNRFIRFQLDDLEHTIAAYARSRFDENKMLYRL